MTPDKIVDEIHEARGRIWAECNNDLDQLIARLRSAESEDQSRLVTMSDIQQEEVPAPKPAG